MGHRTPMIRNIIIRGLDAIAYRIRYYWKGWSGKGQVGLRKNLRLILYILIKEIHVYLIVLLKKSNKPLTKFVIAAQSRAGKTLLTDLLNSNPQIQCVKEILIFNVFSPKLVIKGLCALSKKNVCGFQLKISDLTKRQNIQDPKQFMLDLCKQGWKIIYIKRRNIFRQVVAAIIARAKNKYVYRLPDRPSKLEKTHIDCGKLIKKMEKQEMLLAKEEEILQNLPHIKLAYEDDFQKTEYHQRTADKVFEYLNVASVPASTNCVKATSGKLSDFIQNYEEVVQTVSKTKYAKFLKD